MNKQPEWRITSYMPSSKHFSLDENITPEHITELVGNPKRGSADGKCDYTWEFYASKWMNGANGEPFELTLPCSIWDYKGSRWSGYGPPDAFRELGLLPPKEPTDDEG
jgi:hypothetical protein